MCNKNKQINHISNIISKGHSAFTENFTIFLIKFTKFTIQIRIWDILENYLWKII